MAGWSWWRKWYEVYNWQTGLLLFAGYAWCQREAEIKAFQND